MGAQNLKISDQAGFTIIELVIATLVFSVVLLITTFGVIQVSRTYVKGFIASETENTTRTVMSDVGQAVQLSGPGGVVINNSSASSNWYAFCINGYRYTYRLGVELNSSSGHVLVRDQPSSDAGCVPNFNWTSSGVELLSTNERLVNFSLSQVSGSADLYQINLAILYGDNDVTIGNNGQLCVDNSENGFFCALSQTSTTVQERT